MVKIKNLEARKMGIQPKEINIIPLGGRLIDKNRIKNLLLEKIISRMEKENNELKDYSRSTHRDSGYSETTHSNYNNSYCALNG